jgi:signal transduction histidine kinase
MLSRLVRAGEEAFLALTLSLEQKQAPQAWAHDLVKVFSPKGSLSRVVEVLKDGSMNGEESKALARNALHDIRFAARHLVQLIRPLSDLVQNRCDIKARSLTQAYNRTQEKFESFAQEQNILWKVSPPPESLMVLCDEDIIEYRVIANLVENALRHTPSGGTVELAYDIKGSVFVGWVKDSGEGIAPEELSLLFEAGSQGKSENKGLAGLGLYSVATVLEEHNGRVWAESEPGRGSRFFFQLPLAGPAPAGV